MHLQKKLLVLEKGIKQQKQQQDVGVAQLQRDVLKHQREDLQEEDDNLFSFFIFPNIWYKL